MGLAHDSKLLPIINFYFSALPRGNVVHISPKQTQPLSGVSQDKTLCRQILI